jgi:hypothetical protein
MVAMVIILYQHGCQATAKTAASDLRSAFADHLKITLIAADSASSWPTAPSWDDMLIVVYNGKTFPHVGNSFISQFLRDRSDAAILLPVAINLAAKTPPTAAETIKALEYDHAAKGPAGKLAHRVGAMLGLRLQGRDSKIFISYRATDGKAIATQLHAHLVHLGHRSFLDEAKEIDGETAILPGCPVQKEIDAALEGANLILLLDTPSAPASKWIKHEVDTADSLLLPILPICFRDNADTKTGPRFPSLRALQRWVDLQTPNATAKPPLGASQLEEIVSAAEHYLCEIFQRKCRVPFIVQKEFVSHGFVWKELDKKLLIFESSKRPHPRVLTRVLSHCSIFDPNYSPAIKRFGGFLKTSGRCNYSLFIYDGELLPAWQLEEIVATNDDEMIVLHHTELAALIDTNFVTLVAA